MGSTGHWPVPSGDPPDGTAKRFCLAIPLQNYNTLLHSSRRVADRYGRVARATHFENKAHEWAISKSALTVRQFRVVAFKASFFSTALFENFVVP
jgi:hypothetical protein